MATAAPNLDIGGILSESRRIIKAHSHYYCQLSALFLLPLSFTLFLYPSLAESFAKTLTLPLIIYFLFIFILSLSAVGTITYSTYHGFYGRPVKLVSSIKSLFHTFIPLAATTLVSYIIVILIALTFALFVVLVSRGIELLILYHENIIDHKYSDYFTRLIYALFLMIFVVVVSRLPGLWIDSVRGT